MAQINAYRKDTGEKVRIPEHYLTHKVFGAQFSKTPRQKAADKAASQKAQAPTETPAAGDKKE